MTELYECEPYFERLEELYLEDGIDIGRGRSRYWKRHPWERLKTESVLLAQAVGLFVRLMNGVPEAHLRREYRRRLWRFLKVRQNPATLLFYVIHMAKHYHAHTMAKQMSGGTRVSTRTELATLLDRVLATRPVLAASAVGLDLPALQWGSDPPPAPASTSPMPIIEADGLTKTYRVFQKKEGLLGRLRGSIAANTRRSRPSTASASRSSRARWSPSSAPTARARRRRSRCSRA